MKLYEIYYRELQNGTLGEKQYPFETNQESNWELKDLIEHLFPNMETKIDGEWVTTNEENGGGKVIRNFKFPQF